MLEHIENINHSGENHFFLIAGPCAIEGEQMAFDIASQIKEITKRLKIPFIFKGSYKKANRSRLDSFTGIGDEKALNILSKIKTELMLPVTTDVHSATEATIAASYVDILQIPAFLCRQTELLVAAAKTVSPQAMQFAIDKVLQSGNSNTWLTERGTTFGYQDLVVDFRGVLQMQAFKVPVILDCTHSLQQPNQSHGITGGQPKLIETIAKAGIAVGADGLFIETHPKPSDAKSDGANMLPLNELEALLIKLLKIRRAVL